jgi:hypothetical protein
MTSALRIVTIALLILGVLRASLLVLSDPPSGYANQYDMKRSSACLGLWPVTELDPKAAFPEAPYSRYQITAPDDANCHPSSEILISGLAIGLAGIFSSDSSIDLRWVGGTKLVLLVLLAFTLHRAMRESPVGAFVHALFFAIILCDPFNTLFANSLYTEFIATLGAYLAIGTAVAMTLQGRFRAGLNLLWLLGLVLLGFSRIQHIVLPAVLLILLFAAVRRIPASLWIPSVLIGLAAIIFQWNLQVGHGVLDDANRINAVFSTLLPASPDPARLAGRLGMTDKCAELTNTSWYQTRGRSHRVDCPEAFEISRLKFVTVLATEPSACVKLLFRALHQSGAWRPPYVGETAGENYGRVTGPAGWSVASLVAGLPFPVYAVMYLVPIWIGCCAFFLLLTRARPASAGALAACLAMAMLAAVVLMVHATALLGDGFSEYGRHTHLAHNACAAAWIVLLAAVPFSIGRSSAGSGFPGRTGGVIVASGAIFLLFAIPILIPRLALGYGVLEQPADERLTDPTIALSGWAMDPNGVSRIEAIALNGTVTLLPHGDAKDVEAFFPLGQPPVRFAAPMEIGRGPAARSFLIVVTSKTGRRTVIERRFMSEPDRQP